jgi:hypothetical protein
MRDSVVYECAELYSEIVSALFIRFEANEDAGSWCKCDSLVSYSNNSLPLLIKYCICSIGAGILTLPSAFAEFGYVAGACLLVAFGIVSGTTCYVLFDVHTKTGRYSTTSTT